MVIFDPVVIFHHVEYYSYFGQRSPNKIMISKTADLNDRDFIVRMLHKDSYYFFLIFIALLHFFLQLFYSFLTASVQLRMSTVYKRI